MPWFVPVAFIIGILSGAFGLWLVFSFSKSTHEDNITESQLGKAVLALVREDTESALQSLVHLVNKSTENIDAYMALSNLYREKGWFNRSIDIRRRLLSRSILRPHQRRTIMLEMVKDYEHAGLLDRAVSAMAAIIDATDPTRQDYEMLARLHENAGQLQQAYDYWKKAGNAHNQAFVRVELARSEYLGGNTKTARKYLGQALKLHRNNPSALLLLADITARNGKIRQAEKLFDKLQAVRPDLTGIISDTLEKASIDTDNSQLVDFFINLMEKQKEKPRVAVRYAGWLIQQGRKQDALELIKSMRTDELAPEMMVRLIETSSKCDAHEITAQLGLKAIHRFLDRKQFVCHNCKELIPDLQWKCPRCGRWGSLRSRTIYRVA